MEKQQKFNWWNLFMPCIALIGAFSTVIYGQAEIKNKAYGAYDLADKNNQMLNGQEKFIAKHEIEIQNLKEALTKIDKRNERIENKIDTLLIAKKN
jgi:hypothetical protein